jgi:ankyrin repeat protein
MGYAPLHAAAKSGHAEFCALVLDAGAAIDAALDVGGWHLRSLTHHTDIYIYIYIYIRTHTHTDMHADIHVPLN